MNLPTTGTLDVWLAAAAEPHQAGRLDEAIASYGRILAVAPAHADALHRLGMARGAAGDHRAAARWMRWGLTAGCAAAADGLATALLNLEVERHAAGRPAGGRNALATAAALAPSRADILNGLAVVLRELQHLDPACDWFARAIRIRPDFGAALRGAAILARNLGRGAEATAALRTLLRAAPNDAMVHRDLLWAVLCDPTLDEAERFAEHRRYAARFAWPHYRHPRPHANTPDPERRLRVGYVSSDLRAHSVTRNLEPLLTGGDRRRFALHFYADCATPDAVTARFRAMADGWRDIRGLSDAAVAEQVRQDGIDILVILAGRFDNNRPLIAAHRPAPVQVSFHDGATSGLETMDYLIADPVLVPRRNRRYFTERVLHLPRFYLHAPLSGAPEPGPPPLLRNGFVTFGCFNNPAKLNDTVLHRWGRLLARLPGSRLLLRYQGWYGSARLRRRVLAILAAHGVAGDRVDLMGGALPPAGHLALYDAVDIALDPFPFCGSTTSFEALSMGVPVVTWPQEAMISRWTASLLSTLGLEELIAGSAEDYDAIAARLAGDPDRLADWRATLGGRLAASSLCDGPGKARQLERLYRAVWRRWCRATIQSAGRAEK